MAHHQRRDACARIQSRMPRRALERGRPNGLPGRALPWHESVGSLHLEPFVRVHRRRRTTHARLENRGPLGERRQHRVAHRPRSRPRPERESCRATTWCTSPPAPTRSTGFSSRHTATAAAHSGTTCSGWLRWRRGHLARDRGPAAIAAIPDRSVRTGVFRGSDHRKRRSLQSVDDPVEIISEHIRTKDVAASSLPRIEWNSDILEPGAEHPLARQHQ